MSKFIQFIAGAVCPSCKAQDTIAINTEDDLIYCVKCDFKENRPVLKEKNNQSINVINIDDFKASKS
mgnify:CR=1 FL=1|jgi:uncharacterized metal-binding protein (TIGR02443 family)|tara:strand:+ start:2083 stop:2283 length:201 start_codon:yes stop_codon:yes gene_type:complete